MSNKFVYVFGPSQTDGAADMKNLLGGKGANLAEMCRLGISVPPGLTISTEVCTVYTEQGADAVRKLIEADVKQGVAFVEKEMGANCSLTSKKSPLSTVSMMTSFMS